MNTWLLWTIWWLLLAEVLMSSIGWHGLTVLGRRWLVLPALLLCGVSWLLIPRVLAAGWLPVLGGSGAGLVLFLALAIWRRRGAVPALVFAPGERAGRRIEHVTIPLEGGPLPAILTEPAEGSAIGVLIVHGAGNHKTFFAWPLIHRLVEAGFAACAIDVDGHGDNPRILDFPDVLDDVAAGVAWLRERYRQVAVIGISQGGCIAGRAATNSVGVDALVVMEAPVTIAVTKAVVRREMLTLARRAAWALHRDVGTLGIVQGWRTAPTRTRIGTVALIERLDLVGSVARIRCPLLLCYGGSDAVVPREQAHIVAAAAPPDTTLVIVPRATHLSLSIDRAVGRMIAQWLREALAARQAVEVERASSPG